MKQNLYTLRDSLPRRRDYCKTEAELREWFMARTVPEPNTGCWLWIGAVDGKGYGVVCKLSVKAHRFAYELFTGRTLTPDIHLCHRCDTPLCCNPAHMFEGDVVANLNDMALKDRGGRAKLKVSQVKEIRRLAAEGSSRKELAFQFGVSESAIYAVVSRKKWKAVA